MLLSLKAGHHPYLVSVLLVRKFTKTIMFHLVNVTALGHLSSSILKGLD